ncbi:flagellar L-ring protein [Candidatus Photodesmus katoptron]|nr:flagellar basal body L-ring protein FlgH [Candidatus Photodesmus katoptron]KEY90252.1 flagellar L-ring protein [Candidatus Photodesmus katoptron]
MIYSFLLVLLFCSGCTTLDMSKKLDADEIVKVDNVLKENKEFSNFNKIEPILGDPEWAPVYPKYIPKHYIAETGSLFSVKSRNSLYSDLKPRDVGDIITVKLNERTKAEKSSVSDLSKTNDLSMLPLEVGGQSLDISDYDFSYKINNDNKFTGSAEANQSNSISGLITVEVVKVLPNGNLVIRGEKWLTLNTGDEYIRLSGIIRPDDVSFDNTITSSRISNARIQYSGKGTNQSVQEPGFFARFFSIPPHTYESDFLSKFF